MKRNKFKIGLYTVLAALGIGIGLSVYSKNKSGAKESETKEPTVDVVVSADSTKSVNGKTTFNWASFENPQTIPDLQMAIESVDNVLKKLDEILKSPDSNPEELTMARKSQRGALEKRAEYMKRLNALRGQQLGNGIDR